jgi:hypothetical protein
VLGQSDVLIESNRSYLSDTFDIIFRMFQILLNLRQSSEQVAQSFNRITNDYAEDSDPQASLIRYMIDRAVPEDFRQLQ